MLAASHGRTWRAVCLLQSKGTQSQEVRLALSLIYVHPLFSDGSNVLFVLTALLCSCLLL